MRLMHISDLHLGKRVNEYSMLDDQAYILDEILRIAKEEEVQGVLIAGDVYDRPVPPSGAVRILDDLLDQFADRNVPVFFISGNHDSRERLAFGAALFEKSGVYMAGEELCKKIRWKYLADAVFKACRGPHGILGKRDQYLYGCGTGSAGRNGD